MDNCSQFSWSFTAQNIQLQICGSSNGVDTVQESLWVKIIHALGQHCILSHLVDSVVATVLVGGWAVHQLVNGGVQGNIGQSNNCVLWNGS